MDRIELIIPAYNEEQRIGATLRHYLDFFQDTKQLSLTVVLNGCTDRTLEVVEDIRKEHPDRLSIMNIQEAVGKGGAIVRGWQQSTAEVVGFVDADEATTPEEFQKLITAMKSKDDVDGAIASRFHPDSVIKNRTSALRSFASQTFIRIVKILFLLPYRDMQCGAKLFRRSAIAQILPTIQSFNMIFDVELLFKLHRSGARIVEVPTVWVEKEGSAMLGSTQKFLKTAWTMFMSLLRLRFGK